jgi:hypothetical protein
MKRRALTILVLALLLAATATIVWADKPIATDAEGNEIAWESSDPSCTKIQEGALTYSATHYLAGQPLQVGYDAYGYNYQGHMFKGSYSNVYLGGDGFPPYAGNDEAYLAENPTAVGKWYWPYRDVELLMKWNDPWLANTSCDTDTALDRHFGSSSYIGSGAWETNHMSGIYERANGEACHWTDFVKIIAVPADAVNIGGVWYNAGGTAIGPDIWGEFAIIEEVINDPCAGQNGVQYLSPDHAGFGGW